MPASSVSNFRPDPGGRRWSLIQVRWFRRAAGREGHCCPLYIAQAPGCSSSIWSGPCVACGSSFRIFHRSTDSVGPAFCAFPGPSSSGSQRLDGSTLPGCGAPYPLHGPSLSFRGPRLSFRAPVDCVCLVCVLGGWPLAVTLPGDVNHPESQEVFG